MLVNINLMHDKPLAHVIHMFGRHPQYPVCLSTLTSPK